MMLFKKHILKLMGLKYRIPVYLWVMASFESQQQWGNKATIAKAVDMLRLPAEELLSARLDAGAAWKHQFSHSLFCCFPSLPSCLRWLLSSQVSQRFSGESKVKLHFQVFPISIWVSQIWQHPNTRCSPHGRVERKALASGASTDPWQWRAFEDTCL